MKIDEIRPHSVYVGHGGLLRKVKKVAMDINGGLYVEWKAVKVPRNATGMTTWGMEAIEHFSAWALTIVETLSDDLRHYLVKK